MRLTAYAGTIGRSVKPLAIDLFCGLGGWSEGLLAEGFGVIGFDIERHQYGDAMYPAQLVLQDVLTLHGRQFKNAALIVASPPCQEFSYMAMPWSLAKEKERKIAADPEERKRLTAMFDACFRIQREASEAAGHHIPLIVENVRGAQKWVGRSRWNYGSFHLWGDVPALMPMTRKAIKVATMGAGWYPPDHPKHVPGLGFNTHATRAIKNNGGLWFNIGSPGQKETNRNPVHEFAGKKGIPHRPSGHWTDQAGKTRKAASALIAKIPFELARHIGRVFYPYEGIIGGKMRLNPGTEVSEEKNTFKVRLDPKTIEAVWKDHLASCKRCSLVDIESSGTLVNACPEGVQYIKVLLEKRNPPTTRERSPRSEFWASKEAVAAAMRYK